MYIGHYKAVNSANEFFSAKRKTLDFPAQVEYKGERYSITTTHMATTKSQEKNIKDRAKALGIPSNIKVD
jgi:hypothetical protein